MRSHSYLKWCYELANCAAIEGLSVGKRELDDILSGLKNNSMQKELSKKDGKKVLGVVAGVFQGASLVERAVCCSDMQEEFAVVLQGSKHLFCRACLSNVTTCLCPVCRKEFGHDDVVDKQSAHNAAKKTLLLLRDSMQHGRSPKVSRRRKQASRAFSTATTDRLVINSRYKQCWKRSGR